MRDLCDKLYLHCMDLEEDIRRLKSAIADYEIKIDGLYEEITRLKFERKHEEAAK